jgi:regulatory protein
LESKKYIKLTPSQALLKAANYCAYQERCHKEVLDKLSEWGVWGIDAQEILLTLIEQNYLNEERFAIAFAGGKFRVKHWGKVKIKLELKQKDISEYCLNKALNEISDQDYLHTLNEQIDKKWSETTDKNVLSKRAKVARYIAGKGFEQDLIWNILRSKID